MANTPPTRDHPSRDPMGRLARTAGHLEARTPWPAPPPVLTCCEHPPEAWRHGLWGVVVPEIPRKFDPEFREGAVRIVRETKKPIAVIARDLGRQPGHAGELGQEGQGAG